MSTIVIFSVKLQLQSVGTSLVRIFSKQTCLYVAMAASGKVYTTVSNLVSSGKNSNLVTTKSTTYIYIFFGQSQEVTMLFLITIDANNKEWRHLNELINRCFLYKNKGADALYVEKY